jgi:hypothetical protein
MMWHPYTAIVPGTGAPIRPALALIAIFKVLGRLFVGMTLPPTM